MKMRWPMHVFILTALVSVAGPAAGQAGAPAAGHRPAGGGLKGEDRVRHMSRMLGMTPSQEAALHPIMQEHERQSDAVERDQARPLQERHAKKKAIRSSTDDRIRKILTPAQAERFDRSRVIRERMGID